MAESNTTGRTCTPQLPVGGEANVLSTISQSLSFHASPDSFLINRQQAADGSSPQNGGPATPRVVRAKILNRDVAVVSSYEHCKQILKPALAAQNLGRSGILVTAPAGEKISEASFGIQAAYRELMVDFFPQPNLLLLDAPDHESRRRPWVEHIGKVGDEAAPLIRAIVLDQLSTWKHGAEINLYEKMKDLAWRILLAVFLNLSPGVDQAGVQYRDVVSCHENLLRGQFSLFPVTINTPLWRSPRAKGLDARHKLQEMLRKIVGAQTPACPFHCAAGSIEPDELASNALLFTSSIAVKAVASLLTASLLNLFLFPSQPSLAGRLREQDAASREILLRSILRETERLSPPIIGVMRRVQQDVILQDPAPARGTALQGQARPPTLVPKGWDAWLYFVGAMRTECVYAQPGKFVPERFLMENGSSPEVLAFGLGNKQCLGRDITRQIVQTVATVMLEMGLDLHGSVYEQGVRGWLGWDDEVPVELIARDLKQLPCQRPRKPIKLYLLRR